MAQATKPLVLIVEDEAIIAFGLEDAAIEAGYTVALAASSAEAKVVLTHSLPAVAVLDLRLRDGMTGPLLALDLAARCVPVIVVTGEPEALTESVPAFERLGKPAPPERVVDRIHRAVCQPRYQLSRSFG